MHNKHLHASHCIVNCYWLEDTGGTHLHVVEDKEQSVDVEPAVEIQRVPD